MTDSPVWHPFTQHGAEPPPPRALRAEGAVIDTDHGPLVDAISSWWVITHGHRHPPIMQAIRDASERLDQVIFAGLTHHPAEDLARALVDLAPAGLTRVFYSDSGSTSVEVALKMALGFWKNSGRPRHRIAVLEQGYHGDTIGTMSVGARGVFNAAYEPLLFAVDRLPFPVDGGSQMLAALESVAATGELAALIVEPLVLGAGGMLVYRPEVLAAMRAVCDRHGVLMIADEVMTGWGRTGRLWACDHAGIAPDILCTSKGLTGGAVPLAATLATEAIFAAHRSPDRSRMFFHSSSYTANPIACAAGLANVRIWQGGGMQARLDAVSAMQADRLSALAGDGRFSGARRIGTIAALDMTAGGAGYLAAAGQHLRAHALERGVFLRPLGSTVYVMPPYCIGAAELDRVWAVIAGFGG
ncbi:adenosylmethionine--8-amino-7-oxononanoate transaminase [Paracoccus contaminans]|uniref:Adenosylmethionine-8-amino-7-oxononanoate aminotransferase n=1 Tax=Paracoccus contaminans TaxID=1945662 RepID=A0A1W6CW27_9RHOB|nr:adenosylmethionine--8-amino-7-oxononanoate transaminase [Paracoccus contaminans]ARJ69054.1 adenosylmethionine--8-amino-7-oxononanoate transaminase [Paracoccus contaminans]